MWGYRGLSEWFRMAGVGEERDARSVDRGCERLAT